MELNYNTDFRQKTLTSMDWAFNIFISMIPVVGFIILLVWALGDGNIHRRNWARGMFLMYIIAVALGIGIILIMGIGGAFISQFQVN